MKSVAACLTGCVALFLAGNAVAQTAADFKAGANGQITFVMPSKKIECTYTPKGGTAVYKPLDGGPELSCDRSEPKYVRVTMTPKMLKRYNNVGDQSCCGVDNVFAQGTRWTLSPFVCDSAPTGLTCKRADGKGFFMSAKEVKLQ